MNYIEMHVVEAMNEHIRNAMEMSSVRVNLCCLGSRYSMFFCRSCAAFVFWRPIMFSC